MANEYDEKVNRLIVMIFKDEHRSWPDVANGMISHMVNCDSLQVENADTSDGTYGCDTGCEYVELDATLTCCQGENRYVFNYSNFGSMWSLLDDLDRIDKGETVRWF